MGYQIFYAKNAKFVKQFALASPTPLTFFIDFSEFFHIAVHNLAHPLQTAFDTSNPLIQIPIQK